VSDRAIAEQTKSKPAKQGLNLLLLGWTAAHLLLPRKVFNFVTNIAL